MARKRTTPARIGRAPRRGVAATKAIRARVTDAEYELIIAAADGDISNLIRKGLAKVVPNWPAPTTTTRY